MSKNSNIFPSYGCSFEKHILQTSILALYRVCMYVYRRIKWTFLIKQTTRLRRLLPFADYIGKSVTDHRRALSLIYCTLLCCAKLHLRRSRTNQPDFAINFASMARDVFPIFSTDNVCPPRISYLRVHDALQAPRQCRLVSGSRVQS